MRSTIEISTFAGAPVDISDEQRILNGIWRQHSYDLVALSESFSAFVSTDHRYLVWDYIDHNEIGIAFDHLIYALFDEPDAPPHLTDAQAQSILKLGKALGYTDEPRFSYVAFLKLYFPDELKSP